MIYGIIPVHSGSVRFPMKFLAEIDGMPLFWHVFDSAKRSGVFDKLCLATDFDSRIFDRAVDLGVPVLKTGQHVCGTDRVYEAMQSFNADWFDIVVNIQGDEPELDPSLFSELLTPFNNGAKVVTLGHRLTEAGYNGVRLTKYDDQALNFSRKVISDIGHIGVYAFRYSTLKQFYELGQGDLEQVESLEQMRLMEADIPINIVMVEHDGRSVDVPGDLERINRGKHEGKEDRKH